MRFKNSQRGELSLGLSILLAVVVVVGLGWLVLANDTAQQAVFGPARENIRRETFEQSKAYRDGLAQELRSMQFEYIKAAPEHKAALAQVILHKADSAAAGSLPSDLQQFIDQLRSAPPVVPSAHQKSAL